MRDLPGIWDGDQAIYRFTLRDGASVRDLSTVALEGYIEDEDGNAIGMVPGHIVSAKANGEIDVMFPGGFCDYDGVGKNLVLDPRVYYAQTEARTPATNVLLNPSFDSYTAAFNISCTANGTSTIISAGLFADVYTGQAFSGPGVPANTTVLSKATDSSITVSNNVTAGAEPQVRTFGRYGVADSWQVGGATIAPMVFDVGSDDPAPPAIFGSRQRIYTPSAGSVAYIVQTPNLAIAAGEYYAGGMWTRAKLDAGASITNYGVGGGYFLRLIDGSDSIYSYLTSGTRNWKFETISKRATVAHTKMSIQFAAYDALGYDCRIDDAFLFRGRWAVFHAERRRVPVRPRTAPPKDSLTDQLAGIGGLDYDSNGDGFPDGVANLAPSATFSMERDPDEVNTFFAVNPACLKAVVVNAAGEKIRIIHRAKVRAGDTWLAKVYYRMLAGASGSPANGEFGLRLLTEYFDGDYEESATAGANFSIGTTTWTQKTRSLACVAAHNALVVEITLNGVTGTVYIDDIQLFRTVAGA